MLNVTINNNTVEVENGTTILDAAKLCGVNIPTMCHLNLHDINLTNQSANCRVCMVEVQGARSLMPACVTKVTEGMVVKTNSPRAITARRTVVELMLSNHPTDCLICEKNQNCELQTLAADLGLREVPFHGKKSDFPRDTSSYSLVRDPNKCILCRRCETMCNQVQTVGVYSAVNRGFDTVIGTAFDLPLLDTSCTFCGQCVSVCPTGALAQVDNTSDVWQAIQDPDKYVIVQTAPAVRVALGEMFGLEPGSRVTGKMVAALRRMGFDKVFDTDFAADLTIMEEATELIHRILHKGPLPILTSCCPAWVKFIEHQFPELLDIPSSCKSPQEMFGAIAKTYLAEKLNIDPCKMVVVSIMPCLAKKYESKRPELGHKELADVDYVLTTRELGSMIKEAGLSFEALPDEEFDDVMGESTGAAVIFGSTGGVIEAACRTAYEKLTGKTLENVEFNQLRGMETVREATIDVDGTSLRIAVAHGLGNARRLLEAIRDKKADYHAIEIMACPGGCVGGGGQPSHHNNLDIIRKRQKGLYHEDAAKTIRRSHENQEVQKLYKDFLGEPYGEKAHELLHTGYTKRSVY